MIAANSVLSAVFTLTFLALMRNLAKHFELNDARGIASLSMGIHIAMTVLPILFMTMGLSIMNTGGTAAIYVFATAGLAFVNAIVVYILFDHVRKKRFSESSF